MPSPEMAYSQLHLPRPLAPQPVDALMRRLASDRDAPRLMLELRADPDGVAHLLGCPPTDVHHLRQLLGDLLPGTVLTKPDRPRARVEIAGSIRLRPRTLALRDDTPEAISRALLSAVATRLRTGECVVVQIILGPRVAPQHVAARPADPHDSFLSFLLHGDRPATQEVRAQLRQRAGSSGFRCMIRLGAASPDPGRRRHLIAGLHSAISTAQSPGVNIDLQRERPRRLNRARQPWRWPLRLAVPELVGLLGWPLGDGELPGVAALHPKPLRPARGVHTGDRVFATSAAPGDTRRVGIGIADQMMHSIAYGPNGSGKTTAMTHLILADIAAGRPVCVIDPKWQLIEELLARIPPDRTGDVVLLNAASQTPVGFNPLDVTGRDPDVVVDGIVEVFKNLFHDGWGPRTGDIFSASLRALTRAAGPGFQPVLTDLPRLWSDSAFRRHILGRVGEDPGLAQFWDWYESMSPTAQANALAAPLNKLRQLLLRPGLIRMLGQRQPRFRLRDIWRDKKIVLVPLNEGIIGPGTAELLGSLIIADLWQATQERGTEANVQERPGVVYVDEAPRFLKLPVSLADALAVSRSLGVGWFLAAQFRAQFPPDLRSAIDVNARSKIAFATEADDARDMAKLAPDLTAEDFTALPLYHAYVNLVAGGRPSGWAMVATLPPGPRTVDPQAIAESSEQRYRSGDSSGDEPDTRPRTSPPDASTTSTAEDEAPAGRVRRHR